MAEDKKNKPTHEGSMGTDRNPPSGTEHLKNWHGGKGSARRKENDQSKYADGWDRIFGKKDDT